MHTTVLFPTHTLIITSLCGDTSVKSHGAKF